MECTPDESLNMTVERDGGGWTDWPDDIGFQNSFNRAQVLLGQNMIVAQPGRTVTTDKHEEESLVI